MSGWQIIGNRYPFTYTEPPESFVLERTNHSKRINYAPERTCQRVEREYTDAMTHRPSLTLHVCSRCGAQIGERDRYCRECGARIVEVD